MGVFFMNIYSCSMRGIGLIGNVYGDSGSGSIVSAPGILHELERFFKREMDEQITILTNGPANITIEQKDGKFFLTFIQSLNGDKISAPTDLSSLGVQTVHYTIGMKQGLADFFGGRTRYSTSCVLSNRACTILVHRKEDSFFFSVT